MLREFFCSKIMSSFLFEAGVRIKKLIVPALFILGFPTIIFPLTLGHKGLLSFWGVGNFQKHSKPQMGLRYIPEFSLALQLSETATLDAEVSFHAYGTALFQGKNEIQTDGI